MRCVRRFLGLPELEYQGFIYCTIWFYAQERELGRGAWHDSYSDALAEATQLKKDFLAAHKDFVWTNIDARVEAKKK